MKKFFPLFLGLAFPLMGAFAQSEMNKSNSEIIRVCKENKGTYISYKEGECEYSGCAYTGSDGGVTYDGDNQRLTGGCTDIIKFRNKAKDAAKAEIDRKRAEAKAEADKKQKELDDEEKRIAGIGKKDDGLDVGDLNGDNVVDEKDKEIARRRIANGDEGAGGGAGSAGGGASVEGDQSSRNGGIFLDWCKRTIFPGHPCYKVCTRRSFPLIGNKGENRKACQECMYKYENVVLIGKKGKSKIGATLNVDCSASGLKKGANGECIDVRGGGRVVIGGGAVSGGAGGGGGGAGGTIIIDGSASGDLPAFCRSEKSSDKEACKLWMKERYRSKCWAGESARGCMGSDYDEIISKYPGGDCVNCGRGYKGQAWAELGGSLFPALAHFGSNALWSKQWGKSQQAWAGAAAAGFEQCQIHHNNYLGYLASNELPGLTPEQQAAMGCNGFQLGGFAGMGSAGMGMWNGAGYSNGFIGGMMGPYGGYGMGMGMPGMGMGVGVGMGMGMPGMGMGMPGMGMGYGGYGMGMPGMGMGVGIGGNLGMGMGMPGMGMGYPGYAGGMFTGGMMGGMPGMGGIGMGVGIGGGMGGLPGMGGYGGWGSGVGQYGMNMYGGQGNYWGGMGGMGGMGNGYMDYSMSQQASGMDRYYQQQGMMYQSGMSGGMGGYGGFNTAGFNPLNAGFYMGATMGAY